MLSKLALTKDNHCYCVINSFHAFTKHSFNNLSQPQIEDWRIFDKIYCILLCVDFIYRMKECKSLFSRNVSLKPPGLHLKKKIFVSYYEVTFQDFSSYVTGLPRLPDSIIYSILMSYPILQQSRRI